VARRFAGGRLVVATHNAGKLAELRALLAPFAAELIASGALGLPEPVEDGASFAANAAIKAHAAAKASGLPALADDSGLAVRGLDGAPGIHSARWAGPERDFGRAMQRVHDGLAARFGSFAQADHAAAFVAVLCLAWPDGHAELAEGEVRGRIVAPPRGTGGFGYDPIFQPDGQACTFGEMAAAEKQALSHRGRAMQRLIALCFAPPG
jgi:XTP/dITP diphosphohydrolase